MVSRTEIEAITVVAEHRKHLEYLAAREKTREETRKYCSTTLSDQLKAKADEPARCLTIMVSIPDSDREVKLVVKDTDNTLYYSEKSGYYNFDTLVEFVKEHGFDVEVEDGQYRFSRSTYYNCKKISIKW